MFDGQNKTVEVMENAKKAISRLAARGARKVLALNVADASKVPGIPSAQARQYISALISETNAVRVNVVSEFRRTFAFELQCMNFNEFHQRMTLQNLVSLCHEVDYFWSIISKRCCLKYTKFRKPYLNLSICEPLPNPINRTE